MIELISRNWIVSRSESNWVRFDVNNGNKRGRGANLSPHPRVYPTGEGIEKVKRDGDVGVFGKGIKTDDSTPRERFKDG